MRRIGQTEPEKQCEHAVESIDSTVHVHWNLPEVDKIHMFFVLVCGKMLSRFVWDTGIPALEAAGRSGWRQCMPGHRLHIPAHWLPEQLVAVTRQKFEYELS